MVGVGVSVWGVIGGLIPSALIASRDTAPVLRVKACMGKSAMG